MKEHQILLKGAEHQGNGGDEQGNAPANQHQTFATGFHVSDSMAGANAPPFFAELLPTARRQRNRRVTVSL
ncbi:hypothetical protein MASR2M16_37350 [Thauera terpenica]